MASPEQIKRGLDAFLKAQQLHAQQQLPEAAAAFQRAHSLLPEHPQLLAAYAEFAEKVGDLRAAERLYRKLGEVRPGSGFEGRLGPVLFRLEKYAEAIPCLLATLQRLPAADPDILHALCNAHSMLGQWEDGLAAIRRALAIREDSRYLDAEFNALYHLGRVDELDARLDATLARYPDSRELRSLYALHHLKSGDFANGFRYFVELRWRNTLQRRNDRVHGQWPDDWDGTPFNGVLIINAEQGLGDEIMLSSMIDDLAATGQRALIECDERLLPLYRRTWPTGEFLPRQQAKNLSFPAGTEVRCITALDLARVLRRGIETFPARRDWLQVDSARRDALRAGYQRRWPGKRLVGLSWKSARIMEGAATKNIDISDFVPLLTTPDTVFINLQYGNISADLAALRGAGVTLEVDEGIDPMHDIDGFAAQVAALDLVISTSNTTVHVAGALGIPCWLLLPHTRPILWYWGYRGDTTPWYPSLRLYRNPRESDWHLLLEDVRQALATLPDGTGPAA